MADGKVMQKYYPPDFDPEALRRNKDVVRQVQRARQGKHRRGPRMMEMRMMFPFTLFCENCKDFVYVGTKFNSKVERARGEDYLGIPIWRFYGRCPHCRHQIVFRTDPKNTDYVLESGGTRTYDSNRDVNLAEAALKEAQEQEVQGDAVKALEVKSYSTAEELKTLEALDDLRRLNRRLMTRPDQISDFILQKTKERDEAEQEALDEEEMQWAKAVFDKKDLGWSSDSSGEEAPEAEEDDSDSDEDDAEAEAEGGDSAEEEKPPEPPRPVKFFEAGTLDIGVDKSKPLPPPARKDRVDEDLDDLLDQLDDEDDDCQLPPRKVAR